MDFGELRIEKVRFLYRLKIKQQMEKRIFPCSSPDYVIEVTDKVRREEIVDMLIENFLRDETLVKSLRVNSNLTDNEKRNLSLDERLLMGTVVDSGTVLLALHKPTNRISGAVIIIVHDRENGDDNESNKPEEELVKSRVIKDFYYYAEKISERTVNIREKYPDSKRFAEFELIAVNKLDRMKGLALDLYKSAISLIKEIPGVGVAYGTYTSIYSRKIAEKIGKIPISTINVMELTDPNGKPVFQDTAPHNFLSIMAVEI